MEPLPATALLEKLVAAVTEALNHESRITAVETNLRAIVGDGTGASGLLHKIDEKVDGLQQEFAGIKKVLAFLAFLIMAGLAALGVFLHH